MTKTFKQLIPAPNGRFDGFSRSYAPAEVEKLREDRLTKPECSALLALDYAREFGPHRLRTAGYEQTGYFAEANFGIRHCRGPPAKLT